MACNDLLKELPAFVHGGGDELLVVGEVHLPEADDGHRQCVELLLEAGGQPELFSVELVVLVQNTNLQTKRKGSEWYLCMLSSVRQKNCFGLQSGEEDA